MSEVKQSGVERLKSLDEFTLADLESIRLILRGDSVIDWRRLDFAGEEEVREFLASQELRLDEPADCARMEHVKAEAIAYLRRQFEYPIPRPVERATVPELIVLSAGRGHRAMCACTILKCMHIIHHLDGRELLFVLPMSDQEVFHIVEEKVYRVIGRHARGRLPHRRVRRGPKEQGLAHHEAPLEAGDHRRADLRQAAVSRRDPRPGRHLSRSCST